MTPLGRMVLSTYMRCIARADDSDLSDRMSSATGVTFTGLPARYEKVQTPPHRSGQEDYLRRQRQT